MSPSVRHPPTRTPRRAKLADAHTLWVLLQHAIEHDVAGAASSMAYDVFLSLIPLLALMGWIVGRLTQAGFHLETHLFDDVAPTPAAMVVREQLERLAQSSSVAPLVTIGFLWVSSTAAHVALYKVRFIQGLPPRPYVATRLLALLVTFGFAALLTVFSVLIVAFVGGRWLGWYSETQITLTRAALALFGFLASTAAIAVLYRTAAGRTGQHKPIVPGAVLASILFHVVSHGFSTYVGGFARYTFFYGGLAAVAVLLIWIWLSSMAVLIGAEANALLEHAANVEREALSGHRRPDTLSEGLTARPSFPETGHTTPPLPGASIAPTSTERLRTPHYDAAELQTPSPMAVRETPLLAEAVVAEDDDLVTRVRLPKAAGEVSAPVERKAGRF